MAPSVNPVLARGLSPGSNITQLFDNASTASQMLAQWQNPNDILSLLLLLGPDVIQKSLAQLSGPKVVPVAFSFGWVAYAVTALISAFGDGCLMPPSDVKAIVVSADTGHAKSNDSWIIGRLLRDDKSRGKPMTADKSSPQWESLRVSVLRNDDSAEPSMPTWDWVWASGVSIIAIQFAIAAISYVRSGDWSALFVTGAGTILALIQGSLPQWRTEKWSGPVGKTSAVTITQGIGSRHAVVVLGSRRGLDLSLLANGSLTARPSTAVRIVVGLLAVCWLCLLLTVAGIQQGTWYLLAIGTVGMVQNIVAASVARKPSAFGIHLDHVETITSNRVSKTLLSLEKKYPGVGLSLLPMYYPAGFRVPPDEAKDWEAVRLRRNNTDTQSVARSGQTRSS